jgi:hypothetical protein
MIPRLLFGIALIYSLEAEAQTKSVESEFHINSLAYKGDTLKFQSPKFILINKLGCSDIASIGKIKNLEFGLQIETLISRIGQTESLVVGTVYYLRKNGNWELFTQPEYREEQFNIIVQGKSNNTYEFGNGAGSWDEDFYIEYKYRFTLLR